jgi:hypothetical protein
MITVTLKPDVAEQISHLTEAGGFQDDAEAVVDKALRFYLARLRHEKIRTERQAFEQQQSALLAQYPGEYVAIHEGQVIDHDPNLRTLHLRVFARLGHTPVLLKQVTAEPERELVFRSPRFERGQK